MSASPPTDIIIGVDTHKHTHAAVAMTAFGARVGELTIQVNHGGYRELDTWARSLGAVCTFGIEGTGSYGAGLARFLREEGHPVHEVSRPALGLRHRHGKSDHLDAEGAARAVLGGHATALPKSGTSEAEMIRHLKVARDTTVKARTQAIGPPT
jgi:transposase